MEQKIAELKEKVQAQKPEQRVVFKLWFMDESRLGLRTIRRRRITKVGIKPVMNIQEEYDNTYIFGAFAPSDGSHVIWEMPYLNSTTFQAFIHAMSTDEQAARFYNIVITDNAGAHQAASLVMPENISLLFLPPYSPELNPAERMWHYIKERFAGTICTDLDELSAHLKLVVGSLSNQVIASITSYEWIMDIVNAQLLT